MRRLFVLAIFVVAPALAFGQSPEPKTHSKITGCLTSTSPISRIPTRCSTSRLWKCSLCKCQKVKLIHGGASAGLAHASHSGADGSAG